MARSIDDLVATTRARLVRVDPPGAARLCDAGGLLVDIRPERQRRAEGEIPDAIRPRGRFSRLGGARVARAARPMMDAATLRRETLARLDAVVEFSISPTGD